MRRRALARQLALVLTATAFCAGAPSLAPRSSVPRGRDVLLVDCPACPDGDAATLLREGVASGSEAVYSGAFQLSLDGLDKVLTGEGGGITCDR